MALTFFLRGALRGPTTVHIGGAVEAPYDYPLEHGDLAEVTTAEGTLREVTANYTASRSASSSPAPSPSPALRCSCSGPPMAMPFSSVWRRCDENDGLLLAPQGEGDEASYNVVGARNSKAWVRGVSELVVIGAATLEVSGALEQPAPYDPDDWQFEMDSTRLDLGDGPHKLQGVPLGKVLAAMEPQAEAETVVLVHTGGEPVSLPLDRGAGRRRPASLHRHRRGSRSPLPWPAWTARCWPPG